MITPFHLEMSLNDGDDTRWSSNSCDDWDLEENEERLYSMVYHNSDSYNDKPTPAESPNPGLTFSADNNQNSNNQTDVSESILNDVIDQQPPTTTSIVQENLHHSVRSKASRLDQVNTIINVADKASRPYARNKLDKNMCSNRQTNNTQVPKTSSIYFQNLKKTLNTVEYFQSVNPHLRFLDPRKSKSYAGTSSDSYRNPAANHLEPSGRAVVTNFTFTAPSNTAPRDVPLFRLDDRLFPNVPNNASRFEQTTHLFSNKSSQVSVNRDRHKHQFNQLPIIPIRPSSSVTVSKSPKLSKKALRRRRKNARKVISDMNLSSSTPVQILPSVHPPQTNSDVLVPAIITKLKSILNHIGSNPVSLSDDPVEIIQPTNVALKDSKKIINVDLSIHEVIDLDSDSADSIEVVTPPCKTPPPVIALSDEETATENTLHPILETEHVESSFDFLDSSDEPDVLRKSQVTVFTNLISNSGSKESLLDVRLFQRSEGVAEVSGPVAVTVPDGEPQLGNNMPPQSNQNSAASVHTEQAPRADSLPPPPVVIAMPVLVKQPVALIIDPRIRQKKTGFILEELDVSDVTDVVNIDDESSSHSNNSVESLSSDSAHSSPMSTDTNLILNVQEKSCIDLEINNLLVNNSDNFPELPLAPYERESRPPLRKKRKRECRDEGSVTSSPSKSAKRKKRGKKAREKARHQLQDFIQKRTGMSSIKYTVVEGTNTITADELRPRYPTKWTREMRRFYTNSWGGENYSVQDVQRSMPADQSLWRISWEDRRGPIPLPSALRHVRCFNCSRMGHHTSTCPEPRRIKKCRMCGEVGHTEPYCPNQICLQCGRPCTKYANGCWECRHVPYDLCTKCIWKHDPRSPCMDVRRNPIVPGTQSQQPLGDLREQLQSKRSRKDAHPQDGRRAQSQPRPPRSPWQGNQGGYKRGRDTVEDYDPRHRGFRRSRP